MGKVVNLRGGEYTPSEKRNKAPDGHPSRVIADLKREYVQAKGTSREITKVIVIAYGPNSLVEWKSTGITRADAAWMAQGFIDNMRED